MINGECWGGDLQGRTRSPKVHDQLRIDHATLGILGCGPCPEPGAVKPGNKMHVGIGGMAGYMKKDPNGNWIPNITVNDEEQVALVAYLESLK